MGQLGNCPPNPPSAPDLEYIRSMNKNQMTAFQFFIESLEHKSTPLGYTEDYNEGYADVIESIHYAISSGDVKSLSELDSLINQCDAYVDDFSGDFKDGYKDAVDYCLKQFQVSV